MCVTSSITVGTIVVVKVGRNEIEVVVTEIGENRWKVKKVGSDHEFAVSKIERVLGETSLEMEAEPSTPNSAPESGRPEKKPSLLEAAAQILKRSRTPLNTKEILAKVIESGLWTPNGGKTPEQSLYSAIFREINTKENSRFHKSSEKKGSFEYNR